MASILKVDDLRGNTSAGDITITSEGGSATQSLQQGLAKHFMLFDQTGTTLAAANTAGETLNVSSVTDVATGRCQPNLTNNMNTAEYSAVTSSHYNGADSIYSRFCGANAQATGSFKISSQYQNGLTEDNYIHSAAFGDLA